MIVEIAMCTAESKLEMSRSTCFLDVQQIVIQQLDNGWRDWKLESHY